MRHRKDLRSNSGRLWELNKTISLSAVTWQLTPPLSHKTCKCKIICHNLGRKCRVQMILHMPTWALSRAIKDRWILTLIRSSRLNSLRHRWTWAIIRTRISSMELRKVIHSSLSIIWTKVRWVNFKRLDNLNTPSRLHLTCSRNTSKLLLEVITLASPWYYLSSPHITMTSLPGQSLRLVHAKRPSN